MIIKTARNRFKDLKIKVEEMHPYQVPEIIALPIIKGNASYIQWIKESVASG